MSAEQQFIAEQREKLVRARDEARAEMDATSSRDPWAWPAVKHAYAHAAKELEDFDRRARELSLA